MNSNKDDFDNNIAKLANKDGVIHSSVLYNELNKKLEIDDNQTTIIGHEMSSAKISQLDTSIDINESDIEKEPVKISPINEMYSNKFLSKPFRLGNTYTCLWFKGEPLIVVGPHWPFFICLNLFVSGICNLYFYFFWNIMYELPRNIGIFLYITFLACYWFTALYNPGIPINRHVSLIQEDNNSLVDEKDFRKQKKKENLPIPNKRICRVCNLVIDLNVKMIHCPDCDICVEELDHHCPWTSKCIGKNTIYSFYGFVISLFLLFFFLIFGLAFLKPILK